MVMFLYSISLLQSNCVMSFFLLCRLVTGSLTPCAVQISEHSRVAFAGRCLVNVRWLTVLFWSWLGSFYSIPTNSAVFLRWLASVCPWSNSVKFWCQQCVQYQVSLVAAVCYNFMGGFCLNTWYHWKDVVVVSRVLSLIVLHNWVMLASRRCIKPIGCL